MVARVAGGTPGAQVELVQALDPGKAGLVDAPLAAAGVAGVDLAGEQFGQVGAVGEPVAGGRVGGRAGLGAHGRQVQDAAGRADGGVAGRLGKRCGHRRASRSMTVVGCSSRLS
jgi:hypothetical protein